MSDDIESKCDTVLDANDPRFAEKFAEAIGLDPGEVVECVGPQFHREDGVYPVLSVDDWEGLRGLSTKTLEAMGCRSWDKADGEGRVLMLFPGEWYRIIPEGFTVTTINDEHERFSPGKTDDDIRFGVLAYGVRAREDSDA